MPPPWAARMMPSSESDYILQFLDGIGAPSTTERLCSFFHAGQSTPTPSPMFA